MIFIVSTIRSTRDFPTYLNMKNIKLLFRNGIPDELYYDKSNLFLKHKTFKSFMTFIFGNTIPNQGWIMPAMYRVCVQEMQVTDSEMEAF